jgi:hypothetical protein
MGESDMEVATVLESARAEVLEEACEALDRAHLKHYPASPRSRQHLETLLDLVAECLKRRTLIPISSYAQGVAQQRFDSGFEIAEVQTAFNVVEESIWHVVIARLPADGLIEAAGLVGTVLGAGKDALARTWVSLAAGEHVTSLDLTALFEGAAS